MTRKIMGSIATAALGVAVAGYLGVAHSQASASASPSASPSTTSSTGSIYYLDAFGYATDGSTSPAYTHGAASLIGPLTLGTGGTVSGTVTLTYANVSGMDSCPLTVSSGSTLTDNGDGTATLLLSVGGSKPIELTVLDVAAAGASASTSSGTTTSSGSATSTIMATRRRASSTTASPSPSASPTPSGVTSSSVDLMVVQTAATSSGALGIPCAGSAGPIIATMLHGDMACQPTAVTSVTGGGSTTSCSLSMASSSSASPSPSASASATP